MSAMTIEQKARQEYEYDCAIRPNYHDGTPRRTWRQLSPVARYSWKKFVRDGGSAAPKED